MRKISSLVILLFLFFSTFLFGEQKIFATWEGFEPDKLASIWLIKRFIAPGASVRIYPKGQSIKEGIPFDTPYSEISRKFNRCTFESLLEHYRIKEKRLVNMGRLIHDMEINTWEKKVFKRTREIEIFIMDLIEKNRNPEEIIKTSSEYFDLLYLILPEELELN